ncbi:hypothetical protein B0E55_01626 [Rhodococcus sp. 66b]|nr:hypothetical protein B0E55_01626 [Rhodococcus sp. 66b]
MPQLPNLIGAFRSDSKSSDQGDFVRPVWYALLMKKIFVASLAASAALVLAGCSNAAEGPSKEEQQTQQMADQCREKVTNRLKSPGSAEFGDLAFAATPDGDHYSHIASGWVDSQNGFGALVRSTFDCKGIVKDDGTVVGDVMNLS